MQISNSLSPNWQKCCTPRLLLFDGRSKRRIFYWCLNGKLYLSNLWCSQLPSGVSCVGLGEKGNMNMLVLIIEFGFDLAVHSTDVQCSLFWTSCFILNLWNLDLMYLYTLWWWQIMCHSWEHITDRCYHSCSNLMWRSWHSLYLRSLERSKHVFFTPSH